MGHSSTRRILAAAATSRGVGFVVLEGPYTLVDWGVRQPKPYREDRCVAHLKRLIGQYAPERLVVEDHTARPRTCSRRVESLFDRIHEAAANEATPVRTFRRWDIRKAFAPDGRMTKFAISRRVAQVLPVLKDRLPPYRRPWMSEDYRMAIFDAASLGLTYYHTLREHRNFLHAYA